MQRRIFLRFLLLILLVPFPEGIRGQIRDFGRIRWQSEKIAPGLIWKSTHTTLNDSVLQNINVLFINTVRRKVSILYNPELNIPVSTQASAASALAAVNAGFFSIRDGGSVTYIKTGGVILDKDTASKWIDNPNMNGAIMIDSRGRVEIDEARTNIWYDSNPDYVDVLVTGPLLLKNSLKHILPETSLVIARHPRTAAGTIGRKRIVLLTLDGRTGQSAGMTLTELTDMMISLGCIDAVNLDGGGSTTMWIEGRQYKGVVNMPCDNRQFDHEGERAVSDIIIIK